MATNARAGLDVGALTALQIYSPAGIFDAMEVAGEPVVNREILAGAGMVVTPVGQDRQVSSPNQQADSVGAGSSLLQGGVTQTGDTMHFRSLIATSPLQITEAGDTLTIADTSEFTFAQVMGVNRTLNQVFVSGDYVTWPSGHSSQLLIGTASWDGPRQQLGTGAIGKYFIHVKLAFLLPAATAGTLTVQLMLNAITIMDEWEQDYDTNFVSERQNVVLSMLPSFPDTIRTIGVRVLFSGFGSVATVNDPIPNVLSVWRLRGT